MTNQGLEFKLRFETHVFKVEFQDVVRISNVSSKLGFSIQVKVSRQCSGFRLQKRLRKL